MTFFFKTSFLLIFLSFHSVIYSEQSQKIQLLQFENIYYISTSEFCESQGYDCIVYPEKGKIKIKFPNNVLIFSMNSSFVNASQDTYHMANKVKLKDSQFYLPINSFMHLCHQLNLQSMSVDQNKVIINPPFNISHYTINETELSYVINIFSSIQFKPDQITLNLLDSQQLDISINKGKINLSKLQNMTKEDNLIIQQKQDLIFSFQASHPISNYSYSLESNLIKIIINKTSQAAYTTNQSDWEIKTIIIDPGHGGKDPGAIGYHNIQEKHIVLDISKELGDLINKYMPEMEVIYTREDDTFLGLKNRTSIANKNNGHIFLSIHANSSSAKSARGYEIFLLQPNSVDDAIDVAIRENASIAFEEDKTQYGENQIIATLAQNAFLKESEKLAIFIQAALKKELPKTRNRGIKQAGFHVLVGASMPNLLIEVGFLTNKSEAQLLNKSSYRAQLAKAIFEGVQNYVESHNN